MTIITGKILIALAGLLATIAAFTYRINTNGKLRNRNRGAKSLPFYRKYLAELTKEGKRQFSLMLLILVLEMIGFALIIVITEDNAKEILRKGKPSLSFYKGKLSANWSKDSLDIKLNNSGDRNADSVLLISNGISILNGEYIKTSFIDEYNTGKLLSIPPNNTANLNYVLSSRSKAFNPTEDNPTFIYVRVYYFDKLLNERDSLRQVFMFRGEDIDKNELPFAYPKDIRKIYLDIKKNNLDIPFLEFD